MASSARMLAAPPCRGGKATHGGGLEDDWVPANAILFNVLLHLKTTRLQFWWDSGRCKSKETAQITLHFQLLLNFQNCTPNHVIFMLPSQLITLPDPSLRQSQFLLVLLAQKLEWMVGFVPGKRRLPNPECNGHALRTFSEQSMRGSELKNLHSYLHTL